LLVPEVFDEPKGEAEIPAALMRERLSKVLKAAQQRATVDPLEIKRAIDSFRNFVNLCECKERETGRPCRISGSW